MNLIFALLLTTISIGALAAVVTGSPCASDCPECTAKRDAE